MFFLALSETQNERTIPVLVESSLGQDDDRAGFDDGDASHGPVLLEELCGADLAAKNARLRVHGEGRGMYRDLHDRQARYARGTRGRTGNGANGHQAGPGSGSV